MTEVKGQLCLKSDQTSFRRVLKQIDKHIPHEVRLCIYCEKTSVENITHLLFHY